MAWKRRTNPAWPDAIYFFGSMVLAPLLDIWLGHPLRWMDHGFIHTRGRPSDFVEFFVLLVPLYWLDPIGRILGLPGDSALVNPDGMPKKLPMSKGQQAVACLCIAIALTGMMAGAVAWVMHVKSMSTPDHPYHVENHEAVMFLFFVGGLAAVTFWLSTLGLCVGVLQDAAEDRRRAG